MTFVQLFLVCIKRLFYQFLDLIFKYRFSNELSSLHYTNKNIE